jgi:hypothetical protein
MNKRNKNHNTKIILFTPGELKPRAKDQEALKRDTVKIEKFKKQLKRAYIFRSKHFKDGIPVYKIGYLYELENEKPFEGVTSAYDLGYMAGYQAAQRRANKTRKQK